MTFIQQLWLILAGTWTVLEILVGYKTRISFYDSVPQLKNYQKERLIWLVVVISIIGAFGFKHLQLVQLPMSYGVRQIIALIMMLIGLMIRFYAIKRLGRFFSTTVVIQNEHALITHGLYQFIRHPAYTGLLISFFAIGVAMGDILAILILVLPLGLFLKQRISVEEDILIGHFGKDYLEYAVRTKKLIPWLY